MPTFSTSGSYTVPAGCSTLVFDLQGGGGGSGSFGTYWQGEMPCTPGDVFTIELVPGGAAGSGSTLSGTAGGAGWLIKRNGTLELAVGGGGGGPNGGNAPSSPNNNGIAGTSSGGATGGGGGTASAHGAGGSTGGAAGSAAGGGAGGSGSARGGGGGGGGYFSGGGGGAGSTGAGGGGGGSTFQRSGNGAVLKLTGASSGEPVVYLEAFVNPPGTRYLTGGAGPGAMGQSSRTQPGANNIASVARYAALTTTSRRWIKYGVTSEDSLGTSHSSTAIKGWGWRTEPAFSATLPTQFAQHRFVLRLVVQRVGGVTAVATRLGVSSAMYAISSAGVVRQILGTSYSFFGSNSWAPGDQGVSSPTFDVPAFTLQPGDRLYWEHYLFTMNDSFQEEPPPAAIDFALVIGPTGTSYEEPAWSPQDLNSAASLSAGSSLGSTPVVKAVSAAPLSASSSLGAAGAVTFRGTSAMTAESTLTANGQAFVDPPTAPSAVKTLQTVRNSPNVAGGTHYDMDDAPSEVQTATTIAAFTGVGGADTIKLRPNESYSTNSASPFTESATTHTWRDRYEHSYGTGFASVYEAGEWAMRFVVRRTNGVGTSIRVLYRISKVSSTNVPSTIATGLSNAFTPSTVGSAIEVFRNLPEQSLAKSERLQLELWIQTYDVNGNQAPPAAATQFALFTDDSMLSYLQPTPNSSFGNAPRAAGVAALAADSTLTAVGQRRAVGAAALTADSSLSAAGTVGRVGAAALSASSTLTASGMATTRAAVPLSSSATLTAAGNALAPALAAAPLSASATLTAANVFAGVIVPKAATPRKFLRSSRTSPNSGTVYDQLRGTPPGGSDLTTQLSFIGGVTQPNTLKVQPYRNSTFDEPAFNGGPTSTDAWADLTEHGQHFQTTYDAGNYTVALSLAKSGQTVAANVNIRLHARFSKVATSGARSLIGNASGPVVTLTGTNSFQTATVNLNEGGELVLAPDERLQVELWISNTDGAGNATPPAATYTLTLATNTTGSYVDLPPNTSFGNAPRAAGTTSMVVTATLTNPVLIRVPAAVSMAVASSISAVGARKSVGIAALVASPVLTVAARDVVIFQGVVDLEADSMLDSRAVNQGAPVGATPRKYLALTRTGFNSPLAAHYDLQDGAPPVSLDTTAAFTGSTGEFEIRVTPGKRISETEGTNASWRDQTEHGEIHTTTYQPGTWNTVIQLRKDGQAVPADQRVRVLIKWFKVLANGAVGATIVLETADVLMTGTSQPSVSIPVEVGEVAMARKERLGLQVTIQTLNGSNQLTPPSQATDISVRLPGSYADLPPNSSWGHNPEQAGLASLSAQATLSPTASVLHRGGPVALASDTVLMANPITSRQGLVMLQVSAALSATGRVRVMGPAALQAQAVVTVAAQVRVFARAKVLAADATLTTSAFVIMTSGAIPMEVTSVLETDATLTRVGAAALDSSSDLQTAAIVFQIASATLSSSTQLVIGELVTSFGTVSLVVDSTLTAFSLVRVRAAVSLVVAPVLTVAGTVRVFSVASLVAGASLVPFEQITVRAAQAMVATASFPGLEGVVSVPGAAALVAAASIVAVGQRVLPGVAPLVVAAALTVAARVTQVASALLSANATLTPMARLTTFAAAALVANTQLIVFSIEVMLFAESLLTVGSRVSTTGSSSMVVTTALVVLEVVRAVAAVQMLVAAFIRFAEKAPEIVNYWDGSAYKLAEVRMWNGAAWRATDTFLHWTGSAWQKVN